MSLARDVRVPAEMEAPRHKKAFPAAAFGSHQAQLDEVVSMAKRERPLEWEAWIPDPRVRFARSDGGIRIKVAGHDGWPRESG